LIVAAFNKLIFLSHQRKKKKREEERLIFKYAPSKSSLGGIAGDDKD
jgi:hypothetical protein